MSITKERPLFSEEEIKTLHDRTYVKRYWSKAYQFVKQVNHIGVKQLTGKQLRWLRIIKSSLEKEQGNGYCGICQGVSK